MNTQPPSQFCLDKVVPATPKRNPRFNVNFQEAENRKISTHAQFFIFSVCPELWIPCHLLLVRPPRLSPALPSATPGRSSLRQRVVDPTVVVAQGAQRGGRLAPGQPSPKGSNTVLA